jgi:SagB-type dehydrogenase family enzyme
MPIPVRLTTRSRGGTSGRREMRETAERNTRNVPVPAVEGGSLTLPDASRRSRVSLEETLAARRSVRRYASRPLTLDEISQLLWACQGVTDDEGGRTAPSAGALYPLETWLVANRIQGLEPGIYRYTPGACRLIRHSGGDFASSLTRAASGQAWMAWAPAVIVLAAVVARTAARYGSRAERYVWMEVGHAAQNVYLQAEALGLGTVVVGAFDDKAVLEVLDMPASQAPMVLMPVGQR